MSDDDSNDQSSQSSPHDDWTQALGVPATAFSQVVDVVTGADPAAQPAAQPTTQSTWTVDPLDPSKKPPIDLNLPPSAKYGPRNPAQTTPPVPNVPSQPPPSGGDPLPGPPSVPGRDDPLVGQNKAVDPNDKGWGLKGTWDVDKKPKVTGVYGDLPKAGPVNPQGDPAEISPSPDGPPAGAKVFPQPPGPPPPGKVWNPVLGAWVGYAPDLPKPPPAPPEQPGDYNVPDGDSANA